MSARQLVLAAVRDATGALGRTATSSEVRGRIAPELVPQHFNTALGSLVRTGEVEAVPGSDWPRESRRLYRPSGEAIPVDCSVIRPSRTELVHRAVLALFDAPGSAGRPVSSEAIRRHLGGTEAGRQVLVHPVYLPTALNVLRKAAKDSPALLQAVRIPGVRAQHWAPAGVQVASAVVGHESATRADRIAVLVAKASSLAGDGLVSADHLTWLARRFPGHRIPAREVAGILAESTRPVPRKGGRQTRIRPAVVNVGEVGGRALYAPASAAWGKSESAATAFRWRQLEESWQEARVEDEVDTLSRLGVGSPWRGPRLAALLPVVHGRFLELGAIEGPAHDSPKVESVRAALRSAVERAAEFVGCRTKVSNEDDARQSGVWLTPHEAGDFLRMGFDLGEDPPTIEAGFLAGEVRRVRACDLPRAARRANRRRQVSWYYDRVSILLAGSLRWADPEISAMVSLGAEVLGHVRDVEGLESLVGHPAVSLNELTAAHAVLGEEAARAFLQGVSESSVAPRSAREFARRGLAFLDWIRGGCQGRLWRG